MSERRVSLRGLVVSGAGAGALFLSLDWVRVAIEHALGFVAYPGTFNVRLVDERALAGWREIRMRDGIRLTPPTGKCGGRLIPALVEDAIGTAVIVPDVTRHADDVLELVAPVHLRTMLKRADGDSVMLTIDGA